ncbi:MAG: EAL domain-containing protein [Clostridiales bacterium]|nr:EAL domain-containing protein [Clostridiales bacterium]
MRVAYTIAFSIMIIVLGICSALARRSYKPIGKTASLVELALIFPVAGNLIIIASTERTISALGYYIIFLGNDVLMLSLIKFTFEYCVVSWRNKFLRIFVYSIIVVDIIQFALNPFFGHAFSTEARIVDGYTYFRLFPYMGLTYHWMVDYGILAGISVIFVIKIIRSPRIYTERYMVILVTMVTAGVLRAVFAFSRIPIDRSMISFGVCGFLLFYFSIIYRPMRLLDRMLADTVSDLPEAMFFFDAYDRCIWANDPGKKIGGIEGEKFLGTYKRLTDKFGPIDLKADDWCSKSVQMEEGYKRYYVLEKHSLTDNRNRITGSFLSVRDNTEAQKELIREKYNATHDRLTDLYNKEFLYAIVEDKIKSDPDTGYYIIFVDIKDFKVVNDIFGRGFGDQALKNVAGFLRANFSRRSVYGRIGGDTFGILVPVDEFDEDLMEKKLSRFVVRYKYMEHHILIHFGVYKVTGKETDVSLMFDRAHITLKKIDDEYQTHIAYFDAEVRDQVLWGQHISNQLKDAIREGHVRPYLQPIIDSSGKTVGAEALARWDHPEAGFLSPGKFIPVFEKNGMIVDIDRYMWKCACEILSRWGDIHRDLFVSVNISPKDFYFMDVAAELKSLVREYKIDPSRLRVEITESVMMTDVDNKMMIINDLRKAGFIVEMDDFGSGFSSLNMLKDLPVDVLKIDMKFLNKAEDDAKAKTILQNIINLSEDLGISSLTEGVETKEQHDMLSGMGCKLFQGFYFAEPMPEDEFDKIIC